MSTDDLESDPDKDNLSDSTDEGKLDYVLQSLNKETRDVIEQKGLVEELGRLRNDVNELLSEQGLIYRKDVVDGLDDSYVLPDNPDYRLEDYVSEFDFVLETSAPKGVAFLYNGL